MGMEPNTIVHSVEQNERLVSFDTIPLGSFFVLRGLIYKKINIGTKNAVRMGNDNHVEVTSTGVSLTSGLKVIPIINLTLHYTLLPHQKIVEEL